MHGLVACVISVKIFTISGDKEQEKNQMAVLRMFANLFATKHGEELMMNNFEWVHTSSIENMTLCILYRLIPDWRACIRVPTEHVKLPWQQCY